MSMSFIVIALLFIGSEDCSLSEDCLRSSFDALQNIAQGHREGTCTHPETTYNNKSF